MNRKPIGSARNPVLRLSQTALERAARRAHELAVQTGTDIVVGRDGVAEHIAPTLAPRVENDVHELPARRKNEA